MEILHESPDNLAVYASVPIALKVHRVLDVTPVATGEGFVVAERALSTCALKDYDSVAGGSPLGWRARFDLSGWTLLAANVDGRRAGSAAVVLRDAGIDLLDGRDDLALLWDIRVVPAMRRHGVGAALLHEAEIVARDAGARWLKVETQDINLPACRFYLRTGFTLREVHRNAYRELPDETQLLWYKKLAGSS